MNKILLIEDRKQRQKIFIDTTGIDIYDKKYSEILSNANYEEVYTALKNNTFKFDKYSVIISHKSAYGDENTSIISKLKKYCHSQKKILILFSGGIDANYYESDEGYKLIELNSKTFYSHNLQLFLEDFKVGNLNPLILCYSQKWKLNIMLNIVEKINLLLAENKDNELIFFDDYVHETEIEIIDTLGISIYTPLLDDREISSREVSKVRDSILEYINETLIHE